MRTRRKPRPRKRTAARRLSAARVPKTVRVPAPVEPVFARAQRHVARYFRDKTEDPEVGTISISGERYILLRAASMSVEFFDLVTSLYEDKGPQAARGVGAVGSRDPGRCAPREAVPRGGPDPDRPPLHRREPTALTSPAGALKSLRPAAG